MRVDISMSLSLSVSSVQDTRPHSTRRDTDPAHCPSKTSNMTWVTQLFFKFVTKTVVFVNFNNFDGEEFPLLGRK